MQKVSLNNYDIEYKDEDDKHSIPRYYSQLHITSSKWSKNKFNWLEMCLASEYLIKVLTLGKNYKISKNS